MQEQAMVVSRRKVLNWIGVTAGAAAMYQAMSALSFAAQSTYERNFALSGAPKGTRVLILGAGLAGMTAAYELRKAGYQVKVLEFNAKPGGRCWTLRGGYDGAVLSEKGLPCPNLFCGAHNFHSIYEFLPVGSLIKASEMVIEILTRAAAKR